jgi:hypothetical protein
MDQLIKVLIILFILFVVWQIQKHDIIDRTVEHFANIYEEHNPLNLIEDSERCYNKLYKEGGKYYLVNTRRPMVIKKNPREFNTYNDYLHFAKIQKEKYGCPIIDTTTSRRKIKKSNKRADDPWESYQRRCNKDISASRFLSDNQMVYGEGHGHGQKLLVGNSNFDDKASYNYHEDYDVEACMKDLYLTEHDGLQASPL